MGKGAQATNQAPREVVIPTVKTFKDSLGWGYDVLVNGKTVDIPSYLVKKGDTITVHEKSQKITTMLASIETAKTREAPQWLEIDRASLKGSIKDLPTKQDITVPVEERLVVELYSK